jgi:hypothetical protein
MGQFVDGMRGQIVQKTGDTAELPISLDEMGAQSGIHPFGVFVNPCGMSVRHGM